MRANITRELGLDGASGKLKVVDKEVVPVVGKVLPIVGYRVTAGKFEVEKLFVRDGSERERVDRGGRQRRDLDERESLAGISLGALWRRHQKVVEANRVQGGAEFVPEPGRVGGTNDGEDVMEFVGARHVGDRNIRIEKRHCADQLIDKGKERVGNVAHAVLKEVGVLVADFLGHLVRNLVKFSG